MHLGVQLPTAGVTWPTLAEAARRVEALGYDSLWIPDHLLAWEEGVSRLEAWQVLGALATVTSRIALGPLVSPVTFRPPVVLANMAVTLDHTSGGRAILGLGAGGMEEEHRRFGLPFGSSGERAGRLEEGVRTIHARLDSGTPRPVQARLPILIGGAGQRTLAIAASYADMWNAILRPPEFSEKAAALRSLAAARGRDVMATASFRVIVRERREQIEERLAELHPVWREDAYRVEGTVAEVTIRLREYVQAGAKGLIVQMPAPVDFETLERLAGDIRVAV